jgi:hypothetical protein
MKPLLRCQRLGAQAAELAELGNHVGLVCVTELRRHFCPPHTRTRSRVNESGLKTRQPAISLRTHTDRLLKHASQMLP